MQTNIFIKHTGINKKEIRVVKYPGIPSAIKPDQHCNEIPIPFAPPILNSSPDSSEENDNLNDSIEIYIPQRNMLLFTQAQLNDVTRDLCLSKKAAQLLGS